MADHDVWLLGNDRHLPLSRASLLLEEWEAFPEKESAGDTEQAGVSDDDAGIAVLVTWNTLICKDDTAWTSA